MFLADRVDTCFAGGGCLWQPEACVLLPSPSSAPFLIQARGVEHIGAVG